MKTEGSPLFKINRPLALELGRLAESMPHGSFARIAKMCGFSRQYVYQFFKGLHQIGENNIKILDAANKVLDKGDSLEDKAEQKVANLLNRVKPSNE